MHSEQAVLWYRRMSMVYAFGAWSLLGSAIFLTWKRKLVYEDGEDDSRNEAPLSTSEDSDLAMGMAKPSEGFYVKTVYNYSERPVSQRILTYLKSWIGGPGPQS
ncbi:small integral membrane protein 26 [Mastomys coucha]|uniref:small integral membrane protein 26 n=1 Tax=Mastomys coucha TaxID=35658 RepID=UPI0012617059|nr:small integral membrane protein 26 [Mastomys coucha]